MILLAQEVNILLLVPHMPSVEQFSKKTFSPNFSTENGRQQIRDAATMIGDSIVLKRCATDLFKYPNSKKYWCYATYTKRAAAAEAQEGQERSEAEVNDDEEREPEHVVEVCQGSPLLLNPRPHYALYAIVTEPPILFLMPENVQNS